MANNVLRMKELIKKIAEADQAYFRDDKPIMTDREYDAMMEELKKLETETGVIFAGSPTQKVPGEAKKGLEQVRHSKPMLSANKTKSVQEFVDFARNQDVVLSWKLDGLTLVLRYEKGRFKQAITRGSEGLVGEDVTHTVQYFRNVPHRVNCRDNFEVRGEGVLSWADFDVYSGRSAEQTHPRNIAAGAVRSLTADKAKCSHLDFYAFELISDQPLKTKTEQLDFLEAQGFATVPHQTVPSVAGEEALRQAVLSYQPESYEYPVDGVIMEYDDVEYGRSLGATGHHENRMMALKWQDSLYETTFRGVELITTRTGIVSIVAEFDPVSIEGNMVKRANMHNLGIFEKYQFGVGDTIQVYKANMIVPQVAENLTRSGSFKLPQYCPCCNEKLTVKVTSGGVKNLFCPNEDCIARNAQKIARYCDKAALNIEGLSAVTLENLMAHGWVKSYYDLYHLDRFRDEIVETPGFGPASYNKIVDAVERSRSTTLSRFLLGIGIPMLGVQAARILEQYYDGSWDAFEQAASEEFFFSHISGITHVLEQNIHRWYKNEAEARLWRPALKEVRIASRGSRVKGKANVTSFYDMTVVITGTLSNMTRKKATEILTLLGARVSESVSASTDILIVGENPGGTKLAAAMKNGTHMVTESEFAELLEK